MKSIGKGGDKDGRSTFVGVNDMNYFKAIVAGLFLIGALSLAGLAVLPRYQIVSGSEFRYLRLNTRTGKLAYCYLGDVPDKMGLNKIRIFCRDAEGFLPEGSY